MRWWHLNKKISSYKWPFTKWFNLKQFRKLPKAGVLSIKITIILYILSNSMKFPLVQKNQKKIKSEIILINKTFLTIISITFAIDPHYYVKIDLYVWLALHQFKRWNQLILLFYMLLIQLSDHIIFLLITISNHGRSN